eukprot:2346490-Prymnesium_polylepis.1
MRESVEEKNREKLEQIARERAEQGKAENGGALARAAFQLMDTSEDGELSRTEVVRAFRLDDRVRELLLPLLPKELLGAGANTVTGIDVQAQ